MGTRAAIRVECRLFARYAELAGVDRATLELPVPATVADALRALRSTFPGAAGLPERPMVAVNQSHALPSAPLADGDEVALLPPLAGG
ncbi:MAG TPA: MoaD/ThiS family protein [Gemmatimonadales bacterium]